MRILEHTIENADDGRKIARVIRSRMRISHRVFSELKARGALILDGAPVHANHIVRQGQRITLTLDDAPADGSPCPAKAPPEALPVDILYRDQDLLVIDKGAPLPCQSSPKQPGGTLENRLAHAFLDEPGWVFRPVNRLDKGTSGLMVVARNPHAQMLLTRELHGAGFIREYLAVVCGVPQPPEGVIDAPIGKADGATVRREVRPDGKPARTHYRTLETRGRLSLVRVRLETGRTHQIRVHLSHIGCPVFGDFLYGAEDPRLPGRFALHSAHLELTHPLTAQRISLDSPLPAELAGWEAWGDGEGPVQRGVRRGAAPDPARDAGLQRPQDARASRD